MVSNQPTDGYRQFDKKSKAVIKKTVEGIVWDSLIS